MRQLIQKLVICYHFLLFVNAFRVRNETHETDAILEAFEKYMIIPQCIPNAPKDKMTLIFNDKEVDLGANVHPFDTVSAPYLTYPASANSLYLLVVFDPDIPFLYLPSGGQQLQGMIVNIPGKDVQRGDRLAVYVPHIPYPGASYHRVVYLIYKQQARIKIDVDLKISLSTNLTNFNVNEFAKTFKLGDPVAGNFVICKLNACDPYKAESPSHRNTGYF